MYASLREKRREFQILQGTLDSNFMLGLSCIILSLLRMLAIAFDQAAKDHQRCIHRVTRNTEKKNDEGRENQMIKKTTGNKEKSTDHLYYCKVSH